MFISIIKVPFIYIKNAIEEYILVFKYLALFLFIGFLFRVILLSLYSDGSIDLIYSIIYGFRMDTIVFCAFWLIFIFLYLFNIIKILKVLLSMSMFIYFFVEISNIGFMYQFFARINYIFIEHLDNYIEIFSMSFKLYPLYFLISLFLILFFSYKMYIYFNNDIKNTKIKSKLIFFPFIFILLLIGMRSSFDSSTPNRGFYTFSNTNVYNEIANNSIFSILYDTYLAKKEKKYHYGDISGKEAISNIKNIYHIKNNNNTLERLQKSNFTGNKNIILVILESFGHSNVGYLGGRKLTENIDKLIQNSLYFTNMYAVGTRTSWGISSVLTSLYPIATREYIKALKSQKDFNTIARVLKQFNYSNTFLYSGDINFDNMKYFLKSNGYDNVYGKNSFNPNLTKYTWGYSDEDLYNRAIDIIKKQKKPYFLTLLTMSSHEPFDYPKGKTPPYKDAPLKSMQNAIKYSDYAIGKFIYNLKKEGLLKNTVIGFIADHNENAYNKKDVAIDKYKIASFILDSKYTNNAKKYDKIASQIDFAPTLLDIAGISTNISTMGASILKVKRNSAILLAKRRNFAYLKEDSFVIYKPNNKPKTYNYNFNKISNINKNILEGLSYIQGASYLYENNLYKKGLIYNEKNR
jgi:phosphoglycerol transferase MdoB-like AlkP superfamily enzyme